MDVGPYRTHVYVERKLRDTLTHPAASHHGASLLMTVVQPCAFVRHTKKPSSDNVHRLAD